MSVYGVDNYALNSNTSEGRPTESKNFINFVSHQKILDSLQTVAYGILKRGSPYYSPPH